jgi:hypothetical protein
MKAGRTVIAALMGQAVTNQKLSKSRINSNVDWLGFIFEKMSRGVRTCEEFKKNCVSFITFNFDTNIEDRFYKDTKNAYRDGGHVPEVIHVHGVLPTVPTYPIRDTHHRAFNPEWLDWIDQAATNIRIVRDDIGIETLESVKRALREAVVICFLGFAYAEPNVERLGFPKVLEDARWNPAICGSAYNLETGEQASVRRLFGNRIELASKEMQCRDALRHLDVFRG